jgi:3-oxoadipate enol-lactonase
LLRPIRSMKSTRRPAKASPGKSRGAYIGSSMAAISWSALDRIDEIAAPTLVLSAEHDYEFLGNKQSWARRMQNAEYLEVAGAHHAMPYEMPEVFHAHLEQWLERHRGA